MAAMVTDTVMATQVIIHTDMGITPATTPGRIMDMAIQVGLLIDRPTIGTADIDTIEPQFTDKLWGAVAKRKRDTAPLCDAAMVATGFTGVRTESAS